MRAALQAAVSSQTEMMPSPRRSSCGERRSCHCRPWSAADSATKCSTASARSRSKRRSQSRSLPSHQPRSPLSCRVTTRTRRFTSLPSAPIGPSANCSLHCAVSFCRPDPAAERSVRFRGVRGARVDARSRLGRHHSRSQRVRAPCAPVVIRGHRVSSGRRQEPPELVDVVERPRLREQRAKLLAQRGRRQRQLRVERGREHVERYRLRAYDS